MAKFETLSDCMLIWYESRDLSACGETHWRDEAKYALSRLDCYIPGDTRPGKLESRGRNVRTILQGLRGHVVRVAVAIRIMSFGSTYTGTCLCVTRSRMAACVRDSPPISARIHLWFLVGVQGLRFHFNRAQSNVYRAKSSRFRREAVSRNIRPSMSNQMSIDIRLKLTEKRTIVKIEFPKNNVENIPDLSSPIFYLRIHWSIWSCCFLNKDTNKVNKQICKLETIRTENLFRIYVPEVQTADLSFCISFYFLFINLFYLKFIYLLFFLRLFFTSK